MTTEDPAVPTGSKGRYVSDLRPNVPYFAERQGGHITRAQLRDCGVSKATVARWVLNGRLITVYRGVYAVGHRSRNPIERAHAELLVGGDRAALTGAAALVLWGIWKHWPERPEIVVPGDRRPSGLIAHRSITLRKRDFTVIQGLRVTSAARTLLDAAPRLTEKQLTRAVNDLRLRKLLKLDALIDVIQRNPTHRGVTLLRPLLEIAQPEPTRSELEDAFLKLIRRNRLPIPQMNVHVCGHRVDAYFPQHRLIVELDGWETHGLRSAFVDDRRKDAEILAATGIPTVRFVYDDTVNRVDKTVARLNVILKTRALATPNLQSMTIQVRAATVNDASAIARINVESWRAAYRGIVSERFLNGISISARERAWRERIIVDTTRVTMVAENGGNVLGYCGLSTPSRDEDAGFGVAEIAAIYVHPSLWRTGTGRKLMEAALATLSEAGWGAVTLWVFAANSQARAFYDRYGFTLDGSTQTHPELGPGAVEVRLRLSL